MLLGQASNSQTDPLRFDHITTEQGLSQDIVGGINQDGQGFMWFATENGLNRYDGYSMRVYKHNPRDTNSIAFNGSRGLFVDRSGSLWALSGDFLCRYDRGRDGFERIKLGIPVFAICGDSAGNMWLGTGNGLRRFDLKTRTISTPISTTGDQSLSKDEILSISRGRGRYIWVGTSNRLYRFDTVSRECHKVDLDIKSGSSPSIGVLLNDSRDYLWFSISEHGLGRLNLLNNHIDEFHSDPHNSRSLSDERTLQLFEDRQGNIWVGTFGGLDRFNALTGDFVQYHSDPNDARSIRGDRVYSIFQDRDQALWIGTYRGGVNRTDPYNQNFTHYFHSSTDPNTVNDNDVVALHEDSRGDLWLATGKSGISRYVRKENRFESYFSDLGWATTMAIVEDRRGKLWIGTQGTGLFCFDPVTRSLVHFKHDGNKSTSIYDNSVQTLFLDREGVLWIGFADKGLGRYDAEKGSFSHFWPDRNQPNTGVWYIEEDARGSLFLGCTYGNSGLYSFDKSSQAFICRQDSTTEHTPTLSGSVRAMYEDSDGVLWFASWGGGLYEFDPRANAWSRFSELDGLASDFIKGMLADGHENLWISTENGLSKFDPRSRTFKNFTVKDGLQGNFFWSGSFCKGRDGRMYFGGTNGFNAFHPDSIRDNPNIPPVAITRFSVLDQPMSLTGVGEGKKEVTLSYAQDFFSIEFVALNYTAPEKNRYIYMMEGFDKEWVQAGTRRYVAYTHLDPGRYTFKVKGSNNDGIWNESGATIAITIIPPYWQTFWFRSAIVFLIASILYGIYRYRVGRMLEVERLRSRIAADLHDDVGSNLSSIAIASQLIGRKIKLPDNESRQLAEIGITALRTPEMMKEIVWLLNPKNDLLDDLLLKMKGVAESMLSGVSYIFAGPHEKIAEKVDLDTKRNIYLMYKEILNNVVQHASASKVSIAVGWDGGKLSLTVTDNGKGFDLNVAPVGNGLRNLRERSEHIGGELTIVSSPSRGTTVSLVVEIT